MLTLAAQCARAMLNLHHVLFCWADAIHHHSVDVLQSFGFKHHFHFVCPLTYGESAQQKTAQRGKC